MNGARRGAALLIAAAALVTAAWVAGCARPAAVTPDQHATITLAPGGAGDYPSLGRAVREAPAGATITLAPGVYRLSRPIVVYRRLRIVGAGAGRTIVESTATGLVLGVARAARLSLDGISLRAVPARDAAIPADVVHMQGGRLECADCSFRGAVRARVRQRTGSGAVLVPRGGAGLRATGDARAVLRRCAFSDNDQAGVVREPGAAVVAVAGSGVGPGGRPLVAGPRGPAGSPAVDRFTAALVQDLLRDLHVPGAAVAVVHGDSVLLAHGYGLADAASAEPVTDRTIFRVASITKLFTATAVMQLWERGSLRLSDPVSEYVDGLRPAPDGYLPPTVSELLTHASGYDDRWIGIASPTALAAPPLDQFIRDNAPSRVLPPGSVSSYTNFSMALAGEVVRRASGVSYDAYVRDGILAPLGMSDSGFTTPASDLAWPHEWNGEFTRLSPTFFNAVPSGQLFSTAPDMARFLLMQLNGGRLPPKSADAPGEDAAADDARTASSPAGTGILRPTTVRILQARQFGNATQAPGYTYGFAEGVVQHRRILQQSGDFSGYSSRLTLVPGESLGLFVVCNAERQRFCERFVQRFLERYYPAELIFPRPRPPAALTGGLDRFTGTYRLVRDPHHTLDRWLSFTPRRELVVGRERGMLLVEDSRYVQLEPSAFRGLYSDDYVAFRRGSGEDIAFAFRNTDAYERLSWYETYTGQRRFMIGVTIVLGIAATAWVVGPLIGLLWKAPVWLRRLLRRQPFALRDPPPARLARVVAGVVGTLDLVFLATIAGALTQDAIGFGAPGWLTALLVVPLVALGLTVVQAGFAAVAWTRGWWTVTGRVLYTFILVVAVLYLWSLAYWNLLGFRY